MISARSTKLSISRRLYSTISGVLSDLKAGRNVEAPAIVSAFDKGHLDLEELKSLHEIVRQTESSQTLNQILASGLAQDFSLYFSVSKRENAHQWDSGALKALLEHNPGRVFSLADLLRKHTGSLNVSDEVRAVVVNKLLHGEKCEADDLFRPELQSVTEAIAHLNKFEVASSAESLLISLIERLDEIKELSLLRDVKIPGFTEWLHLRMGKEGGRLFFRIGQIVFEQQPLLLSKASVAKLLEFGYSQNADWGVEPKDSELQSRELFLQDLVTYIESNKLDVDKKDPESLLIRLVLTETYGIHQDKIQLALDKYHHYQTHEKFGIELVQAKLVKAYCYQAFANDNPTYLKIAETLVNHDELSVSTVAQLILASSKFSAEKSLEVFNEYISNVSKKLNDRGRSPSGRLVEAVMAANLYDNDREFAQLIFEKAIASGAISDEHEIAKIKKVFKVYGDAFVEDDWSKAKPIFGEFIKRQISEA